MPPRAPEEAAAKPALPRVRWQPAFCGTPAQLPHLMRVGGVRVPGSRRVLSTDTSGRYADTTVSPPVTEAARRITVLSDGRRVVTSRRRAYEQTVIMICCRRAEACAAIVCAEATA
jgi:hypothetical protein